jgi:hypothetical protein
VTSDEYRDAADRGVILFFEEHLGNRAATSCGWRSPSLAFGFFQQEEVAAISRDSSTRHSSLVIRH